MTPSGILEPPEQVAVSLDAIGFGAAIGAPVLSESVDRISENDTFQDHRDCVIGVLAADEAALRRQLAEVQAERDGYRTLLRVALNQLFKDRATIERQRQSMNRHRDAHRLLAGATTPTARKASHGMSGPPTVAEVFDVEPSLTDSATREFRVVDEGRAYVLALKELGITFSVDRLRRKWDELVGELTVLCTLSGARTYNGVLSVGDFNFSNIRGRYDRVKYLTDRSQAPDIDWVGLLEEFSQRVLTAERDGQPAVLLRDLPKPTADGTLYVDGLPLLARHPVVWFGDGGAAKSYLALYIAGRLEQRHGVRVGLFDWELAGEDHRERLERLFGADLPAVRYARCNRPFVHELDRLRRIVRDEALDYVIFDSIAFACDGPPEAAEVAGRYFQSLRQLGIVGSLHIAHISKSDGADQKPFGSAFWHNGARATWNVKLSQPVTGGNQVNIGLYNRKSNLGGLRPAVGFEITFETERTTFKGVDVADVADLAGQLSIRQRMAYLLRRGAMEPELVASELDAKIDTVKRTARKYPKQFTLVKGRVGLIERRV